MITTEYLTGLDKFSLAVKKRVTSKYSGSRASVTIGKGITVTDHRIYAPGDDFRSIDWKIFARTDNLYVKKYEEEKNLTLHVILDCSASMNYGKPMKFDFAAMLGVGFAYLAFKDNERFQFATFSDDVTVFQPRRGMGHFIAMVDYLNKIKIGKNSKLLESIKKYKKTLGSRSLIIIISDFLYDIEEIKSSLVLLANHELKVIQVLDATEKELKIQGDVKLHDSESDATIRTVITPRLVSQYDKQLADHIMNLERTCFALHADFHVLSTDTPIFDAFYEILK